MHIKIFNIILQLIENYKVLIVQIKTLGAKVNILSKLQEKYLPLKNSHLPWTLPLTVKHIVYSCTFLF